ncbi:hypothetical protein ASL11_32680 [Paenibacillus sp. Soil750]|nr:hypothetical protein ASL11_32680 [Paenibacillus sp. Soil750]
MREKKLVALLTNHDDDVYCFRKELIENLIKENYDVLISCPFGEKLELMTGINYIYDDVKIDRRGTNIFTDIKLLLHYYKLLKKYKPDVVLGFTAKPNIYGSLTSSFLKIPYINNVTGLGSVLKKQGTIKKFILFLFKIAFRNSQCIFFQNEENLELAKKQNLIQGEYQLIPGSGVNTDRFPLQKYPHDSNGIVFNYIGRVLKDKGVDDYFEAAKIIKKKYSDIEFNVIGFIEPTETHYIKVLQQLEMDNIVIYRGSQMDVRPYIARAHATIHPSTYGEGMSNVLLESASSGRPLITTNISGCKETLVDGKTGLMYRAGDVEDLVSKIEIFLHLDNETREEMGKNGREKVKREFSRDYVVMSYLEEIERI